MLTYKFIILAFLFQHSSLALSDCVLNCVLAFQESSLSPTSETDYHPQGGAHRSSDKDLKN